eukprot:scaffold44278_cov221-Amphora_coffeaeformis.AAC.1
MISSVCTCTSGSMITHIAVITKLQRGSLGWRFQIILSSSLEDSGNMFLDSTLQNGGEYIKGLGQQRLVSIGLKEFQGRGEC